MVRRPPTRSSVLIAISLLVAFVIWTWLTFNSAALAAFDLRTAPPPLDPGSAAAEIAAAFALVTWPGVEYAALAAIALWALRHRLRQLAVALVLVIALMVAIAAPPVGLAIAIFGVWAVRSASNKKKQCRYRQHQNE